MYIEIKNVTKTIKNKEVLSQVSLSLEAGKIHGFVGANASGKTMLFRAICGFIKLDEGMVKINQQPVVFNSALPVDIGLILETPGFIGNQTVMENLKYLASLHSKYDENLILELLRVFDIEQYVNKKVSALSLGTRQKIGIIQAVMENQELLVLDEPTNGLDKESVAAFIQLVERLKKQGKTILLASHNEYELRKLADTITEISEGKIANFSEI
ncbi:ABC transporter ATP-binding protein [Lactococcus allomyrinae]|uniref:ATP-binding cassette domain-containing protein n=1 Tax=Lactococcus allomyrinae TaxID=2419773 RepID=A0A387BHW4_9LACT|nr:ATP-binding cassette domain-containing protein [Lactococcus allomyrinae]AYG01792.1 ATP-binding cassette domain-containing protein [Lactococcus allomyrinae]